MEDSLKGLLIAMTLVVVFTISMFSFIIIFVTDQGGILLPDNQSTYVQMNTTNNNLQISLTNQLVANNANISQGFNQWDVTVGFMGSGTIKQTTQGGVISQLKMVFNALVTTAVLIFKANSPIIYVMTTFFLLMLTVFTIIIIKFVRTGV